MGAGRTDCEAVHAYQGVPFEKDLAPYPTVLAALDHHARGGGDDPFVTAVPAVGDPDTLTYRQAHALSGRLARWVRRELGITEGVVGLAPRNDLHSVVAVLGLLRAGCTVLLLAPTDPVERMRKQAGAVGAVAVLRAPAVPADHLPEAVAVPDARQLEDAVPETAPTVDPAADALIFGTSGSTAASKLVAQSHRNAAVNADAVRRHHGLRRGERLLGCLPVHHVNGLHFTLLATLVSGGHAILAHGFDPLGYPRVLRRFAPRIASVVPSVLEALLETWRDPVCPPEFEYFVSAAAPLSGDTAREVGRRMGLRVLQGYGLSETTNFSTTMPRDLPAPTYRRLIEEAEIPSAGVALHGNEVAVLRSDGERAAPGETGEICMRGHNVMSRYVGNEAETAKAFRLGWFHSQDLGVETVDEESGRRFLFITGRSKNIAKVAGETVSLDEMDRVLRAHPQVRDAACVSRPHRLLGEEILAAVVCPAGLLDADLRTHLAEVFAGAVLPSRLVRMDAIPRTPTGKIRRPRLAGALEALAANGDADAWEGGPDAGVQ